ncbi:hypothetical protein DEJ13_14785 [Curtobacterium sp. MCLR17_007]|uniref:hypothetical protein n=1 Tax=unclassified Curtobacterium TaxID=257496 RepID=UPI0012E8A293|nr:MULTISPECIES: hypothetical protein [unclassified Curtobacterium]WIB59693.1 hypothetical protein DEJ13_14785 [Curtobacterium sp. MCLR17_007]
MSDTPTQQPDDSDVARRARAAEDLPLPERADAFAGLHDELRTRLESGGNASV